MSDHHSNFLDLIAVAAHTTADQIVDMDLFLYDANPAVTIPNIEPVLLGCAYGYNKCIFTDCQLSNCSC